MQTAREKFQELLKKLFQFDCAELDFGIYRIMNHKRDVIEKFIEKDLLNGVEKELSSGALAHESGLAQQLAELAAQIKENIADDAIDAEGNLNEKHNDTKLGKQYLELRAKAVQAKSRPELEALIFNHLYSFFSRYYDEGDFMALRRYSKRDKYAIPYNGEEVYLHWANSDQYYIKTAENFTDYSYKHNDWIVKFILRNAEIQQNNKKGAKRFFIPRLKDAVLNAVEKILTVPFEYRPLTEQEEITYKSKPQETILTEASTKLFEIAKSEAGALSALATEKRKDTDGNPVSLIEHHLRAYTRKNTSDFFIHKDLKGFLERELDFYLKNEVLNLDELEAGGEQRTDSWFQIMHTMKNIGRKIIAFVAQIENFQKRIFEKQKFVTEVNYCITLDRIPEEFYLEIVKNKAQIEEWKKLFHIHEIEQDTTQPGYTEPLKVAFLKEHQSLVLDTKFFSSDFKDKVLASKAILGSAGTLDEATNGLLIHGDNFQALSLIQKRYYSIIEGIYIDPPYNTDASAILYKNDYKDSSWLTLMENRLYLAYNLLKQDGIICVAIDDEEVAGLRFILSRLFDKQIGIVPVRSNPAGRKTKGRLAPAHEYALFFGKSEDSIPGSLPRTDKSLSRFPKEDEKGRFAWANFIRSGTGDKREDRPTLFYPIFVNSDDTIRIPKTKWDATANEYILLEKPKESETVIYPRVKMNGKTVEKRWQRSHQRVATELDEYRVRRNTDGNISIDFITRMDEESLPITWWDDKKYASANYGAAELKDLFGEKEFDFAKSRRLVEDCLRVSGLNKKTAVVLDYFGGSGTTGHAVLNLNREDGGKRKFILVEMGEYFETILKPRVQKVIYAKDWKEGRPQDRHSGISHCFKYISLESYEDALDNITFTLSAPQMALQFEDYVLSYMLDFETKTSDTLLNVAKLDSPFDFKLRLYGKDEPLPIDLPETFNYLIGLHVDSRKVYDNKGVRYLVYHGKTDERDTVVIWRTIRGWGEEELKADKEFVLKHKLTEGVEDIFINGDSFIPGSRSLDPIFKQRMFTGE